jgi:hypothetical protein
VFRWTSDEVVALIAGGAALLGSALSGIITFGITKRQVDSSEAVAAKQRAHELDMARQAREHEYKKDACVKASTLVATTAQWAAWKLRDIGNPGSIPQPEPPPSSAVVDITGTVALFMSDPAYDLFVRFCTARDDYEGALKQFEASPKSAADLGVLLSWMKKLTEAGNSATAGFRRELELDEPTQPSAVGEG